MTPLSKKHCQCNKRRRDSEVRGSLTASGPEGTWREVHDINQLRGEAWDGARAEVLQQDFPDNEVGWAMEERWKNRVGWTRSRGVCSAALMPVTSATQVSNRESTGRLPCTTAARVTTCTARSAPAGTSPVRRMKQSAFGATASWKESVNKASEASFPGASLPHLNAKTLNVRFSRPSRAMGRWLPSNQAEVERPECEDTGRPCHVPSTAALTSNLPLRCPHRLGLTSGCFQHVGLCDERPLWESSTGRYGSEAALWGILRDVSWC